MRIFTATIMSFSLGVLPLVSRLSPESSADSQICGLKKECLNWPLSHYLANRQRQKHTWLPKSMSGEKGPFVSSLHHDLNGDE